MDLGTSSNIWLDSVCFNVASNIEWQATTENVWCWTVCAVGSLYSDASNLALLLTTLLNAKTEFFWSLWFWFLGTLALSPECQSRQEAQLSPRDRAMSRVSWNLANCHATVQKLLVRQVLNKSKLWSWRVTVGQCVINMCTQPWRNRVTSIVL